MLTEDPKPTLPETSSRFAPEPVTIPVERLQAMVRWFTQQPDVPVGIANALQATAWLAEVEAFRQREERLILDGKYDASLADHRVGLSDLIADGEAVVWAVKKFGMSAAPVKFTVEDLRATLESLHTVFRCEHGPKNSQKTNELIAGLFDGKKPGN
jgi:hypothetical protein